MIFSINCVIKNNEINNFRIHLCFYFIYCIFLYLFFRFSDVNDRDDCCWLEREQKMALRKNHLFVFILFLCICSVVESMCGGGDVVVVVNWWIVLFLGLMVGAGRGRFASCCLLVLLMVKLV